jgi:hypothetical protein
MGISEVERNDSVSAAPCQPEKAPSHVKIGDKGKAIRYTQADFKTD